jgi:hypothetical protein
MQHTPVQSTTIQSIAYEPATRELEVLFKSGGTYRYQDVDARTHAALMSAPSIGSHFHKHIRPKFTGTKVGGS